jgi:peptide/nickel transport system ATP-binding protein
MTKDPLLSVRDLRVSYGRGPRRTLAVRGVTFSVAAGEALGLVGESSCGKSSIARAVMQLSRPFAGEVRLHDLELHALKGDRLRRARRRFQMIFQDPVASLNPRMTVGEILRRAVQRGGPDVAARGAAPGELLERVGLDPVSTLDRRAFELSGGQCQRVAIARALVLEPELLVCDEPVSSLDVSVQAQVLNLLRDIRARQGLSLLFISHDLAVVRNLCDRVAVMFAGRFCEVANGDRLFGRPRHPYTSALLAAAPSLTRAAVPAPRDASSASLPATGCRYRHLCPRALPRCAEEDPDLTGDPAHLVACHNPVDAPAGANA